MADDPHLRCNLLRLESLQQQHVDNQPFLTVQWRMVADIFHHLVELQPQVAGHVERHQIVLERDAAVLLAVPFQRIEHHIAESVDEPRLQTHVWRVVLQRLPVVLHQVQRILVSQRHKVQVLFLAQLIPLVEDVIAYLTVPVEILTDNVGIALAETAQNLFV